MVALFFSLETWQKHKALTFLPTKIMSPIKTRILEREELYLSMKIKLIIDKII